MNRDPIFDTVSSYLTPPAGWGFPTAPSGLPIESQAARNIRLALFPYGGDEGIAQLLRWYYSIIRSRPAIALGFGEAGAVYDPGLAWKPPVAIGTAETRITADPTTGLMRLGWMPGTEIDSLEGSVLVNGGNLSLKMGETTYPLLATESYSGDIGITWPQHLDLHLGLTTMPSVSFPITFRPAAFNAASFVSALTPFVTSSMLTFTGVSYDWTTGDDHDKLALIWAMLHDIRHGR